MTDSVSPFDKQIANRNYMSPLGFKLIITKTPKVDFLCQSANIPSNKHGNCNSTILFEGYSCAWR